jgi:DHA1 family tetracycline resistance protein-like MFS transporter
MKKLLTSPLVPIFLIVFIGLLGFGIILPLLPLYAETFGASPFTIGVLLASYSLMQLVATPYLGALSDRFGRRPVLIISQIGTVLSFTLLGLANSLLLLFIARILDGISGGNISTAQAYISDITDEQDRAKAYGLIGAAFGLGFILGPAIGGFLSQGANYHIPAFAAAAMSLLSLLLTIFVLPESLSPERRNLQRKPHIIDTVALRRAWGYEQLGQLLLIFFLMNVAQAGFQGLFALFNNRQFAFGARETGYILAYVGVLAVLVQGGGIGPMVRRFGERRTLQVGLALAAIGLVWAGFVEHWQILLLALVPVALGLGVTTPTATSLITRESPPAARGQVLGISQSFAALARILGPLTAGLAFEYEVWGPFVLAGVLIACACAFSLRLAPPSRPSEDPRFQKREPVEKSAAS